MNEELIENIVSDCGYEALGLYEYLYSIRDKKYDVTITSLYQIAEEGAYFDIHTLLEAIDELKKHRYLMVTGNIYLFPRVVENYDSFF